MRINFVVLLWLVSLTMSLAVTCCKRSDPVVHTPISGETILGADELEISFEKPFKPTKQVSKVCFEYADDLSAYDIAKPPQFRDGVNLQLDAFITDQNGKRYDLDHIENSVKGYLCIRPSTDAWYGIASTDTTFVKLTVRSNRTIHISKTEWVAYSTWEI